MFQLQVSGRIASTQQTQDQQQKHQKRARDMFKVNNEGNRMADVVLVSPFSKMSIVDFEHVF